MSLELLKEKFRSEYFANQIDGTGLTHLESVRFQYEKLLEEKQKVIEKLENETHDLSKQTSALKKEKNSLLHELDRTQQFETAVFSIKEKDYIHELQSKENIIEEIKSEFDPL